MLKSQYAEFCRISNFLCKNRLISLNTSYLNIPQRTMTTSEKSYPVVAVIGASGVGKSKLAIDLALQLNGECINADAMQVYIGLDISTNKVSTEEKNKCPHHLLGIHDLIKESGRYTVHNFQKDALPLVNNILRRRHVPILVGGTMYYIEAVLFDHLVPERSGDPDYKQDDMKDKTNEQLFAELERVDPKTAYGLHPNDRRKVIRALEVFNKTGKLLSAYYAEQHALSPEKTNDGNSEKEMMSGKPRYNNSLMIWLHCDQTVLDTRLDVRIDEMIRDGLMKELDDFYSEYRKQNSSDSDDQIKESIHNGVLQSIGLKEFIPFLELQQSERENDKGKAVYEQCVEMMKTRTRRYARKQLTWIRNRFFKRRSNGLCPPVFQLDVTEFVRAANDVNRTQMQFSWKKIFSDALAIVENSVARGVSEDALRTLKTSTGLVAANFSDEKVEVRVDPVIRRQCTICKGTPVFVRESQWRKHVDGWRHIKTLAAKKKCLENSPFAESSTKSEMPC